MGTEIKNLKKLKSKQDSESGHYSHSSSYEDVLNMGKEFPSWKFDDE